MRSIDSQHNLMPVAPLACSKSWHASQSAVTAATAFSEAHGREGRRFRPQARSATAAATTTARDPTMCVSLIRSAAVMMRMRRGVPPEPEDGARLRGGTNSLR